MSDLWVYVGKGIEVYFGLVLSGEHVPRGMGEEGRWCDGVPGVDKMEIRKV